LVRRVHSQHRVGVGGRGNVGTSGSFNADDDEFANRRADGGGREKDAPLVAESLANFECKVRQIIEIGASGRTQLVIGDVLVIHVEDQVLDGTRIDHDALGAVGRMAGNTYIRTRDRFEVGRPI
jgi:flavin reductase (DIM6/NTAB) family NADH-FMN oxidoreductase RutF